MIINVTQEHIDSGRKCSAYECPIALALLEQYPNATGANVYGILFVVTNEGVLNLGNTPAEVYDKILNFDDTGVMEPFSFEI